MIAFLLNFLPTKGKEKERGEKMQSINVGILGNEGNEEKGPSVKGVFSLLNSNDRQYENTGFQLLDAPGGKTEHMKSLEQGEILKFSYCM